MQQEKTTHHQTEYPEMTNVIKILSTPSTTEHSQEEDNFQQQQHYLEPQSPKNGN